MLLVTGDRIVIRDWDDMAAEYEVDVDGDIDMPDYETYLPMFGNDGKKLLRQLHKITSSLPNQE